MASPCTVRGCGRTVGHAPDAMVIACPGNVTEAPEVFCLDCARRLLGAWAFHVPMAGYWPMPRHARMY